MYLYHIRVEAYIKEVLRALGKNAPGCREFVKHFCDCFVNNVSNIGCTAIAKQGRWCGIRIYGPWAECSNHYDITKYLNWRDVSSLCLDPSQECGLVVYAQSLGDDGKVHGSNTHHHVATFPVNSGGSIMMSDLATGCSSEGRNGLPLTLPTTHHKKTYFTHQSKQIPCIRMALIVDFVKLDKKMYPSFIQEKYNIPDSLVFTPEIQDELTRQFQQPNTRIVPSILQERWLVKYNELIEYNKLNKDTSDSVMPGKLENWVFNQRTQYRYLQENKKSNMTEERIELLEGLGLGLANAYMRLDHSKECIIIDCEEPRWSNKHVIKHCQKHRFITSRCRRCSVKALEGGAETFCLDCKEKFRIEMDEAVSRSLS